MNKKCNVPRCSEVATGYSTLCNRHKAVQRRHGHPEQLGVTVQELAPYRKRVQQRMSKNKENSAWGILEKRWAMIIEAATAEEAEILNGRTFVTHQREAQNELIKLANEVPINTLIEISLAMFLLQEEQPRRFKSDEAFDAQLVRRTRALTETNAGTYWDGKTKRVKRVYRDVSPRTLAVMAHYLKAAFGPAGLYVARLEQQEQQQADSEQAALSNALESLK